MEIVMNCVGANTYADVSFPNFAQPIEIGHFSLDSDRNINFNKSQLSTLAMVVDDDASLDVDLDLNQGFSDKIAKKDGAWFIFIVLLSILIN